MKELHKLVVTEKTLGVVPASRFETL